MMITIHKILSRHAAAAGRHTRLRLSLLLLLPQGS